MGLGIDCGLVMIHGGCMGTDCGLILQVDLAEAGHRLRAKHVVAPGGCMGIDHSLVSWRLGTICDSEPLPGTHTEHAVKVGVTN